VPFSNPDAVAPEIRPVFWQPSQHYGLRLESLLVFTCSSAASDFSGASSLSRAFPRQPFAAPHSDWWKSEMFPSGRASISQPRSRRPSARVSFPRSREIACFGQIFDPKQNELNVNPPVLLMKGRSEDPFLISWSSRRSMLRGLAFYSAICIWCGPILTLSCLYILLSRLGYL
jgi:hypothetical protein